MKREPIGYIYMFTNRINGKKYIGQHEYKNGIDENYFGSGSIFAHAKEKYGIENFKFDILCWCNSKEELDNAESYFIGFKYYTYANTGRGYNIAGGGNGGNTLRGKTEEELKEYGENMSKILNERYTNMSEEERKEKHGLPGKKHPNYGKHHSEETKKKMSDNHADVSGEKNPMFGKNPFANKSEEEMREIGNKIKEAWNNKTEEEKREIGKKKSVKMTGEKNPSARKVRCLETGEEFTTVKQAREWCGLKGKSSISSQIQGKRNYAGKHPITGEKLHWEYVDEETIETNLNLSLISNISISLQ